MFKSKKGQVGLLAIGTGAIITIAIVLGIILLVTLIIAAINVTTFIGAAIVLVAISLGLVVVLKNPSPIGGALFLIVFLAGLVVLIIGITGAFEQSTLTSDGLLQVAVDESDLSYGELDYCSTEQECKDYFLDLGLTEEQWDDKPFGLECNDGICQTIPL